MPKKIVISMPNGNQSTYLYADRAGDVEFVVSNRSLIRIAIAQFVADPVQEYGPVEIALDTPLFDGPLTPIPISSQELALKVRPGKQHSQTRKNLPQTR